MKSLFTSIALAIGLSQTAHALPKVDCTAEDYQRIAASLNKTKYDRKYATRVAEALSAESGTFCKKVIFDVPGSTPDVKDDEFLVGNITTGNYSVWISQSIETGIVKTYITPF